MFKCKRCQTEYYAPGECDWCPDEKLHEVFKGTCEEQLASTREQMRRLEIKAAKWDSLPMMAHRLGVQIMDVIRAINERTQG